MDPSDLKVLGVGTGYRKIACSWYVRGSSASHGVETYVLHFPHLSHGEPTARGPLHHLLPPTGAVAR